ncbi:MAG: DUF4215 domain-containing protein [Sandaracinus sp.]
MSKMRFGWAALCAAGVAGAAVAGCDGGTTQGTDSGTGDAMAVGDANVPPDGRVDGGRDGGDRCAGLTLCTTAGTVCEGNTLVTCAADANGCMVETRTQCTATAGQICDATSGTAACVDACSLIPAAQRCTTEGRTCNGDVLEICAMDANGCLVTTDSDCAAMSPPTTCDDTGSMPVCAAIDPCAGIVQCGTAESRVCTDSTTLTVCAADAMGCYVESTMTCTGGTVCDMDTTTCVDPCAGLTLCPSSSYCDSTTGERVTCARDANLCLVETARETCATGSTCDASGGLAICNNVACPEASMTVIDCNSGQVSGDTATGSSVRTAYAPCSSSTSYGGNESIFVFRNSQNARVTIRSTRLATSGDFDLFAINPGTGGLSCGDDTLRCDASSTGTSATETISFNAVPNQGEYIVYDIYSSTTATTAFTLDITCVVPTCGDGMVEAAEPCDDGNTTSGDGCSSSCQLEPGIVCYGAPSHCAAALTCGNGVAEMGETCDDGNTADGDGCSSTCANEPGYTCVGTPGICTRTCGNGAITAPETCDDGNFVAGDGCSASCLVEPGFACIGTPSVCQMQSANATCAGATVVTGSGTIMGDTRLGGGPFSGMGCTSSGGGRGLWYQVQIPPTTRVRAVVTPSFDAVLERVDDCSATSCSARADGPEDLTFVNATTSPITTYARVSAYSAGGAGGTFSIAFTYTTAVCGNGTTDVAETCDDGNTNPGDGCSATCTTEPGYSCAGQPSTCFAQDANALCANATVVTGTTTLAGSTRNGGPPITGTGCTSSGGGFGVWYAVQMPAFSSVHTVVTPAAGFDAVLEVVDACGATACSQRADGPETLDIVNNTASPVTKYAFVNPYAAGARGDTFSIAFTYHVAVCGNGTTDVGETCDDGNTTPGDGCSALCAVEGAYHCAGAPSVCYLPPLQTTITAACVTGGTWTSPTRSSSTSDDATTSIAALPFSVPFFGTTATYWSASTNGIVQLYPSATGATSTAYSNSDIPSTSTPNGFIAGFWDDLYLGTGYDLHYQTTGTAGSRVFVVEWLNALAGSSGTPFTFQIMLYEATGVIEIHYCSIGTGTRGSGDSATIGLENATGTDGVRTSYNTAGAATAGSGYRYTPQ